MQFFNQKPFDIELLDIDKRWLLAQAMRGLLPQVKRVHLIAAREGAAHAPLHALGCNALVNAQALEYFQRFLCVTNAA